MLNPQAPDAGTRMQALDAVLDTVFRDAGQVLRSPISKALLNTRGTAHSTLFWQAYFQAILSPAFGALTPGDKWREARRVLQTVQASLNSTSNRWPIEGGTPPLYVVAQFWTADDHRAAAFVVNARTPGAGAAATKAWYRRWEVMAAVNDRASASTHAISVASLGNLLIRRARDLSVPSTALGFCVGADGAFSQFVEEFHRQGAPEPASFVQSLSSDRLRQLFGTLELPRAIASRLLDSFPDEHIDITEAAEQLEHLSVALIWEEDGLREYLAYAASFFYYRDRLHPLVTAQPQPPLLDHELKLLLLNNLGIVRSLVESGVEKVFQYFMPTYHTLPSYLAVVTDEALAVEALDRYTRFAERLFGLTWAHDSIRKLDQDKAHILERAEQAARAAIMSRNLSHNIGSHVLASPRLSTTLGVKKDAKRGLETFHQYVQARLDFVARAIGRQTDRTEPLLFVGEVLNGFFRQNLMLETLLADRGFPLIDRDQVRERCLRFHLTFNLVHLPGRQNRTHTYELDEATGFFAATEGSAQDDVLIGVPGGVIGCQAIYAFLENVMRNAAKYGRHRDDGRDLDIHLSLRDAAPSDTSRHRECFVLEVWDSLSDDDHEHQSTAAVIAIRQAIQDEIILKAGERSGEINPKGHGIQEMKIAAGILAGDIWFKADNDPTLGVEPTTPYLDFLLTSDVARITAPRPLRCFCQDRGVQGANGRNACSLIYQVLIPKARLVGIVDERLQLSAGHASGSQAVWYHATAGDLAVGGAALGVLLDVEQAPYATAAEVAKLHEALPFRLVILTHNPDREREWEDAMRRAKDMPARRVHVVNDDTLHRLILNGMTSKPDLRWCTIEDWGGVILRLFDRWLQKYKPREPGKEWNVLIGFQREHAGIESRWREQINALKAGIDTIPGGIGLQVAVCTKSDQHIARQEISTMEASTLVKRGGETLIVFDNHGRVFTELANSWSAEGARIYHQFGRREISLSQALESPPQDLFAFLWFLLQLVEGALTEVVILDERFAEATIGETPEQWMQRLQPFCSVRIHAAYSVQIGNGPRVAVSERVRKILDDYDENWRRSEFPCVFLDGSNTRIACVQPRTIDGQRPLAAYLVHADAIVIHEGVADDLVNRALWSAHDHLENELKQSVPRIIRTSGRGATARHLSGGHPFIEFSELSEVTYRSMNKPALGRAVISVTGTIPLDEGHAGD